MGIKSDEKRGEEKAAIKYRVERTYAALALSILNECLNLTIKYIYVI